MPKRIDYGSYELKEYIKKTTYKAFAYSLSILFVIMVYYFVADKIAGMRAHKLVAPPVKLTLTDLPPEQQDQPLDTPPPPDDVVINNGPAARAGNPVAVPESEITPDMQEFAAMDELGRASAEGGNGIDNGGFSSNIDFDASGNGRVENIQKEEEPDPNEFIAVEKEPAIDLAEIQKLVEYPALAKRASIEGQVVIKALVDKTGLITKVLVEHSDNSMLNESAVKAVKAYRQTSPAIQNKVPISCWVTIPIRFALR